jgi:protein-S-isoprenylcysteine O-methyltransferase Ste14
MGNIGEWLAVCAVLTGLVYVTMSWARGRASTTRSTRAIWAKSLLNSLLFFGLFIAALPWGAQRLLPLALPVPSALRSWGGGALFSLGIAGWIVCLDAFSRRGRGTPSPLDAPSRLVTDGLHAVVRNPMIVSELIVLWGVALWAASLGVALYALATTLGAHWVVLYSEEPQLRARFGKSYEEYCENVPRWLPRLRS